MSIVKSQVPSHHVSSSANGNQTNSQDYEAQMRRVIYLIYKQWGIIQKVAAIIIFINGLTKNQELRVYSYCLPLQISLKYTYFL